MTRSGGSAKRPLRQRVVVLICHAHSSAIMRRPQLEYDQQKRPQEARAVAVKTPQALAAARAHIFVEVLLCLPLLHQVIVHVSKVALV